MNLRRARSNEACDVAAFQHAAYARNRDILGVDPLPLQADYARILADYEVWLDEAGGQLVGVIILEPRRDDLLVWSVATAPDARSRSIGNALLSFAEARARELGQSVIRLYTGEPLVDNIAWYQRRGYGIEATEARSDRRIVHMVKNLRGE